MKAKEALRVPGSITYKGWILTDAACSVMKRTIILEVLPKKKEKKKANKIFQTFETHRLSSFLGITRPE